MKPLYMRAIEAAATLDELNQLCGFPEHTAWDTDSLRTGAPTVATLEAEMAGAPT